MRYIISIKRVKYHKDRFNLFIEKKFFCTVPDYLVERLKLKEGVNVPEPVLEEIEAESLKFMASECAYRLLTMRPHSTLELRQKLLKKGFSREVISPILKKCLKEGYLNDQAFAEAFVKARLSSKPRGRRMLYSELLQKGIERDIAMNVLNQALEETSESELAFRLLQKNRNKLLKEKSVDLGLKIRNFLSYRGFGYEAIRLAAGEFLKTIKNEEYDFDE